MKRLTGVLCILALLLLMAAYAEKPQNTATSALPKLEAKQTQANSSKTKTGQEKEGTGMQSINITIGTHSFNVQLYENEATLALVKRLPLTLDMGELNGNEKYDYLPEALPTSASRPDNIKSGDLMLYGSDCLVLFYEDFSSSYSYTRLGYMEDPAGLAQALGRGGVSVTLSEEK